MPSAAQRGTARTRVKQVQQVHHKVLVNVLLGHLGVCVAADHVAQQELVHYLWQTTKEIRNMSLQYEQSIQVLTGRQQYGWQQQQPRRRGGCC